VPDKEKPSTWKLRLWEDPEKKVTRAQLGKAAAALSPGGFRGNRVDIPSSDLPVVKRKIRAEYKKLNVDDKDIPKWVKESEMRKLVNSVVTLEEAEVTAKGVGKLTIIKPGFNSSKTRYYPKEVLARDFKVFEGNKMFADHPTEEEEYTRPERSIKDWVAVLTNVAVRDDGALTGDYTVVEPWFEAKLAKLRDAGKLSELGVSIRAVGSASRQEIDGVETDYIERLVTARSVDFVTFPGAGGNVDLFESETEFDVDLIDESTLRKRRPDIVESIEGKIKNEINLEVKTVEELNEKIKSLEEQVANLTKEKEELQAAESARVKVEAKNAAQTKIKEAVEKSGLPEITQKRILARFAEAETADGIETAISDEKEYLDTIRESGKPRNMGGNAKKEEVSDDELQESFKQFLPEEQAKIAARGR
jgi:FtsZ-binding cell division protein ZapB